MWQLDWSKLAEVLTYNAKQPMILAAACFVSVLGFSLIYMLLQKKDTARILFVTLFSYYFYYKSSGFIFLAGGGDSDGFLAGRAYGEYRNSMETEGFAAGKFGNKFRIALLFQVHQFLLSDTGSFVEWEIPAVGYFLPVGISFFTFQSLSYTIDVYRRELVPLNRLLDYTFYVSFFRSW